MEKGGLIFVLINVLLKLPIGFGLWRMAMNSRDYSSNNTNDMSQKPQYYAEDPRNI